MRNFCLSLCLCVTFAVSAAVDLEQTMKNMGFQFKQAIEATDSATLLPVLDELIAQTEQAQQATFAADKAEQFRHGLTKVLTELEAAKLEATKPKAAKPEAAEGLSWLG